MHKYTTFEDQRQIPVLGFNSISVALPIDLACQWFERKFGKSLEGWETWTEDSPESDIIVHNPRAIKFRHKPETTTPKIKPRKETTSETAWSCFKALVWILAFTVSGYLIYSIIRYGI